MKSDHWKEDSGKRSLNERVIEEESEKTRRRMNKMREKKDNGRGNGIWHDAMRSEGSYTSLFLYSNHLRLKMML